MRKKRTIALLLASVLCLAGCTAQAESDPTAEATKTAAETTAFADTPDMDWECGYIDDTDHYWTYDEFIADYSVRYPDAYVYPCPAVTDSWKLLKAELSDTKYLLDYQIEARDMYLTMTVFYPYTNCKNIDTYLDAETKFESKDFYEKSEDYAICRYESDGSYGLYCLYGEEKAVCKMSVRKRDITNEEQLALLLEFKEIMGL